MRAILSVSLSPWEITIGCRRSWERLSAIRDNDRICTRHVQTMWATQYPPNIGLKSGTSLFIFSWVHIRLPPLSAARNRWCRLFFDLFSFFSNGTSLLPAFSIAESAYSEECWAKTSASTHLPPPATSLDVLNHPVGIPCPAMKTIATSPVTSETTPPTHHLAAAHTPRPALPLSPPWLIYFRMLCLSTPCLFLLRDSTSNRKSSLPKVIVSFSQSKVALVLFCIATSPLLRRWLWSILGPLRWELRVTQRVAVDRTRLTCQRRQFSGKQAALAWSMILPTIQRGYCTNCVLH